MVQVENLIPHEKKLSSTIFTILNCVTISLMKVIYSKLNSRLTLRLFTCTTSNVTKSRQQLFQLYFYFLFFYKSFQINPKVFQLFTLRLYFSCTIKISQYNESLGPYQLYLCVVKALRVINQYLGMCILLISKVWDIY